MGETNLSGPLVVGEEGYTITLSGKNGTVLTGEATVWDDLRFPATSTKVGSNSLPNFDFTNVGLLFPQNNADEKVYIAVQMPHARKLGSSIRPHLHYIQDEATVPIFKMSYRWYPNGGAVPGSYTTITSEGAVFTRVSGSILQILTFPEIEAPDGDTVSSMMDIILWREDNVVTGDVLMKEFDIHIEIDSTGSALEFTKTVDE